MPIPSMPSHKHQIKHYKTLVKHTVSRHAFLKSTHSPTKSAQYIQYHRIKAQRQQLAHYLNCLYSHTDQLDILSGY